MNRFSSTIATLTIALAVAANIGAAKVSPDTIRNLNAARQGEANANHRYETFAAAAEAEGLPQAAKLFRAAARAEAIHRDTHEAAILELGGAVDPLVIEEVTPGATAENLQAAIEGETYERDVMYPSFLALAQADDAREAIRSFQFALAAEKEHAVLYRGMLANLADAPARDYFVCTVCGFTTAVMPGKKCPSCRNPVEKFVKVL